MNLNEQDLKGLSDIDSLQIALTAGVEEMKAENLTPEAIERFKYSLLKGHKIRPEVKMFWDSAKLGTYDPELKIPNRFINTYKKENKMNSTETLIEQGEGYGLGITQEGVGYA